LFSYMNERIMFVWKETSIRERPILKKLLSIVAVCFVFFMAVSMSCFAQEEGTESQENILQWLEPAEGDWYSTKGNLTMTIQGDYINNCKILGAQSCTYDYPQEGTFCVAEAAGNRNIKMDLFGNNVHQYLIIDDKMVLRRSIHPEYNESVGGIYLGMTQEDVLQHYTRPVNVIAESGTERWEYGTNKFAIIFKSNIVVGIRLYKDSTMHFDKSGLGAAAMPTAYEEAYGMDKVPVVPVQGDGISSAYKIGHGEFLFFGPEYVQLSVYNR